MTVTVVYVISNLVCVAVAILSVYVSDDGASSFSLALNGDITYSQPVKYSVLTIIAKLFQLFFVPLKGVHETT